MSYDESDQRIATFVEQFRGLSLDVVKSTLANERKKKKHDRDTDLLEALNMVTIEKLAEVIETEGDKGSFSFFC